MPLANPKIYIRSYWKQWDSDILIQLKQRLHTFRKALKPKFQLFPICHNLLPHQCRTIGLINRNPNLMVVKTDKFLNPGSIDTPEYFRFSNKYHIVNAQTYQRLIPAATAYCATLVRKQLEKWVKTYLDVLSKEERKRLCTNLRLNKEPSGFLYLIFRLHKFLLKTLPVV